MILNVKIFIVENLENLEKYQGESKNIANSSFQKWINLASIFSVCIFVCSYFHFSFIKLVILPM